MDKNYLIYQILSPKINLLVKLLGEKRKVLRQYWYLERCFFYPSYEFEEVEIDFIARLSFYFGGVRERIERSSTKKEIVKELKKVYQDVFLASLYNFEPEDEIFDLCNKFHDEIEHFLKEDILGCILGISLTRFWIFKLKNRNYEILQNNKILFKGKTSEYGTIALDTISEEDYILKIQIKNKFKIRKFKVSKFSSGIKMNIL
ncbi:MAG TPA: hypothetical protein VJJ52_05910 [Candidatus Nanoarchaeia archaeon]|nr:hypothetical protein [Candidatus Nanoarchaeia archaeon]